MTIGIVLLVVLPLAAIAYIIWDYRRKTAARTLASAGKLEELLTAVHSTDGEPPPPAQSSAPRPGGATLPASPVRHVARERLLSAPHTLLYYLLKTGMPDHLVFACVRLGSLLEPRTAAEHDKVTDVTLDFVVTDRNTRPVAVVQLRADGTVSADRERVRIRLASAGVSCVELDPMRLPRKEAIRSVVLNGSAAPAAAHSAPSNIGR